jgi:hypothetical protein
MEKQGPYTGRKSKKIRRLQKLSKNMLKDVYTEILSTEESWVTRHRKEGLGEKKKQRKTKETSENRSCSICNGQSP